MAGSLSVCNLLRRAGGGAGRRVGERGANMRRGGVAEQENTKK